MKEYIEREAAIEAAIDAADEWEGGYSPGRAAQIRDGIYYVPAADVRPVVRGRWRDTGSGQECSVCKEIQYGYDTGRYFCPNCGAEMKED